jgi:hypothetical protein
MGGREEAFAGFWANDRAEDWEGLYLYIDE